MSFVKQGEFNDRFTTLADKPNKTASEMKALFESQPAELRDTVNNALDLLMSVADEASGADNIGMTAIAETGENATVQAVIEALIARLKAITDSASGADLIGATAIADLDGATVQALLESLKTYADGLDTAQTEALEGKSDTTHNHDGTYEPVISKNTGFNLSKSDAVDSDSSTTLATSKAVKTVQDGVVAHRAETMPHKFTDGATVYRWGFRSVDGQPQFIYEEVSE